MSTHPTPSGSTGRRRKRRKANQFSAIVWHIWRDWWVEITIAVLMILAVFLLVERMDIREAVFAWLVGLMVRLTDLVAGLALGVAGFVRNTTLSDLTAYALLLVVASLVAWRIRQRLLTLPRLTESRCPRCGGELHRIHRRWGDRILSLYLPVRRYQCKDEECRWQGLRVRE